MSSELHQSEIASRESNDLDQEITFRQKGIRFKHGVTLRPTH
jgi:hypothetical protein